MKPTVAFFALLAASAAAAAHVVLEQTRAPGASSYRAVFRVGHGCVLRATLPSAPGPVWFGVVQTCDDNGREVRKEWTQVPKEGTSTRGLPLPAALLQVEPAAAEHVH